jgi:hypothetical protein
LDSEDNGESNAFLNVESDSFDRWNRVRESDGAGKGNEDDDSDDSGDTEDINDAAHMGAGRSCEPLPYPSAAAAIPYTSSTSATSSSSSSSSSSATQSVQETAALPATSPASPTVPFTTSERAVESKPQLHAVDDFKKSVKSSSSKSAVQIAQDNNTDIENAFDFLGKKSSRGKK